MLGLGLGLTTISTRLFEEQAAIILPYAAENGTDLYTAENGTDSYTTEG